MDLKAKNAEKELQKLRESMTELKKNISNPDFVVKFKKVRTSAMDIYRQHSELITKDDLLLFGILVKKQTKLPDDKEPVERSVLDAE